MTFHVKGCVVSSPVKKKQFKTTRKHLMRSRKKRKGGKSGKGCGQA